MIIDCHTHIAKVGLAGNKTPGGKEDSFETILGRLQKEMNANSVDLSLVIPWINDKNWWDPTMDQVLELAAPHKNIKVIGTIDALNFTPAHLNRLSDLLKSKKIVGVKIYTGYQHIYPSDERLYPIYKTCIKYDAPVMFHSGDTYAPQAISKVKYSHPMQIDDLAADFKELKIIIAHLGNPWLTDTAEMLYKNPNVYADISGFFAKSDIKLSDLDVKLAARKITDLVAYAGARKLLYGTDWPLVPMKFYLKFVQSLKFSPADRDLIMYKNALNIFKINP